MSVVYLFIGRSLGTIVQVLDLGELELVTQGILIGIGQIISCIECAIELYALLRQVLAL